MKNESSIEQRWHTVDKNS